MEAQNPGDRPELELVNVAAFHPTNAITCADLSAIAYSTPAYILHNLASAGYRVLPLIEKPEIGARVIIASKMVDGVNVIVVSVRGSANVKNFIADANCFREVWNSNPKYLVHRGFKELVMAIRKEIMLAVYSLLESPDYVVLLTGHSLGAIAASLLMDALSPVLNILACYTYGEPMGRNLAFARHHDRRVGFKHHRIVDGADIVTRSPLFAFRLPLQINWHGGNEYFINDRLRFEYNPSLALRFLGDVGWAIRDWKRGKKFADTYDHHVGLYQRRVREAVKRMGEL